jgi:hypothetical protein
MNSEDWIGISLAVVFAVLIAGWLLVKGCA